MTPALDLVVDGAQVTQRALAFPDQARALRIIDAVTYQQACDFLLGVKALRDEIAQTFDPHIARAHQAHKALLQEKQHAEAPLAEAERLAKSALVAFDREQEEIRRQEQRRLQEEARRQEEERQLEEAIALEQAAKDTGDVQLQAEAEQLMAQPPVVPTVVVAPSTPKVSGISYRETYSAKVTDLLALVQFVAAHPQYLGLLTANTVALNGQARSLKTQLRIPGVEVVCTRDVAAGRR